MLKLLASTPQKQEDGATPVLSWLTLHRDWLLLFDNVRECALVQRFVPASHHSTLLLTTRLPTLGTLASCLQLHPLSLEESTQLLLSRAETRALRQHARPISREETLAARAIAAGMGGLPLALDLAAAYPHAVESTFTLAFAQLQRQNAATADLLSMCCFLAADKIPEALLVRGAPYLSKELLQALSDPLQIHRIFKDLLTHVLLRRDAHNETLHIHHLVQVMLKGQVPEMVQRAWIERLIHLLDQLFVTKHDRQDTKNLTWNEQMLPHIQQMLQQARQWPIASFSLASLLCKTATYLFQRTCRTQGEALSLRALLGKRQITWSVPSGETASRSGTRWIGTGKPNL